MQADASAHLRTSVLPTMTSEDPVQGARGVESARRWSFPGRLAAAGAALVVVAGLGGAAVGLVTGDSPVEPSGDPVADGAQLDEPEQLLASLLSDGFGECSPLERAPGQAAKLNCDQTPDGIASLHVVQWEGADAMGGWFRTSYVEPGNYTSGPCGEFEGGAEAQGTGRVSSRPEVGAIACYVNANGHAVMLWQIDDRDLSLLAIRDDADAAALFDWWQDERDTVLRTSA